jgi:alpha-tubulin suppressor-like RCC1 family protein
MGLARSRAAAVAVLAALLAIGTVTADVASAADGLTVSLGDQSGLERDSLTGSVFVPVYLSAPADEPVIVSYSTADGSAVAGSDYTRWGTPTQPRTVTIPAGSVQSQINVPVLTDDQIESDEDFSVIIEDVEGANTLIGDGTGTATIVDADGVSDANPAITVSATGVAEGDQGPRRAQFQIHLSRAPASSVTITYTSADGSATAGDDYVAKLPGTVVFAPGQVSKTIDVLVTPDSDANGLRAFALEVTVAGGSPVEEIRMRGTAEIVDDDEPTVDLTAPIWAPGDAVGTDAPGPTGFTASWPPASDDTGVVAYEVSIDGAAPVVVTTTNYPVSGRRPGTQTAIAVVALDAQGNRSQALQASVETADGTVGLGAGTDHRCALNSNGTIKCWGRNTGGSLGSAAPFGDGPTPVGVPGISGATDVTGGVWHTCASSSDGRVRCFGDGGQGQLGNGGTSSSSSPVTVSGITDAINVSASHFMTCATRANGTIGCWGLNSVGQLGNGTTVDSLTPVQVQGISTAVDVAAMGSQACAILAGGTVRCWGSNSEGALGIGSGSGFSPTPVAVPGLTDVTSIAGAAGHVCAVDGGTVKCWGLNDQGQLGTGTTTSTSSPVTVAGIDDAVQVVAGLRHTCALLADGEVRCWGKNSDGQLADSTRTDRLTPVASAVGPVVALTAGGEGTCAVRADASGVCWGVNSLGQLGNGTSSITPDPVEIVGMAPAVSISTALSHSCAVHADHTVSCWGYNAYGQLGNGTVGPAGYTPSTVVGLTDAVAVATGYLHTCALRIGGAVSCWGSNGRGALGTGASTLATSAVPVTVPGITAIDISAGGSGACAVLVDGRVKCWGSNSHGQVGNGSLTDATTPKDVVGITDATSVEAGDFHTCVVRSTGGASCWGTNINGGLGNGSTVNSSTPVTVSGLTGATQITGGNAHSCALLVDQTARCWGSDGNGRLGNGPTGSSTTPSLVTNVATATSIDVGQGHSCVVSNGAVRCWGWNHAGQLGDGTLTTSSTAVTIDEVVDAVQVSTQNNTTCALAASGSVFCWGAGSAGATGNPNAYASTPVMVLNL